MLSKFLCSLLLLSGGWAIGFGGPTIAGVPEWIVDAARSGQVTQGQERELLTIAMDGSEDARIWATGALARAGVADERMESLVIDLMQDRSFRLRSAGAWAAGYVGLSSPAVIEQLAVLLRDSSEVPRSTAATALRVMGGEAIDEMEAVVIDGSIGDQINALSGLRGSPEGLRNERYRRAQRSLHPEIMEMTFPDTDPAVNLLVNGGFEDGVGRDGRIQGWELVLEGGAKGRIEVDTGRSRSGKQSLRVIRENTAGQLYLRSSNPVTVPAKTRATFRGYFKADDAPSNTSLLFRFEDEQGSVRIGDVHRGHLMQSQTLLRNSPAGFWDKRLGEYVAGDKDEQIWVRIYLRGNPAEVWLDDLSFPSSPYRYSYSGPVRPVNSAVSRASIPEQPLATDKVSATIDHTAAGAQLRVNGEVRAPVLYFPLRSSGGDYDGMGNYAEVPLLLVKVPVTDEVDNRYPLSFPVWRQAGRYDFTSPLEDLAMAAESAPRAGLVLNFNILWPSDWVELNPDHAWLNVDGQRAHGTAVHFRGFSDTLPSGHRWWPSPYSEKALAEAGAIVEAFLREVRSSPYADRIVGCFISGGHDGQFFTANWPDYSEQGKAAFRKWLGERYLTDEALRKAWNRDDVSLASASIPDLSAQPSAALSVSFYDPATQQDVADYRRFITERGLVIREYFARIFKEEMGEDTIAMTWQMGGGRADGTRNVFLESEVLDILIPQPAYEMRVPGYYGGITAPLAGYRHHNKLAVKELDLRTWLRSGGPEVPNQRLGAAMSPEWWRNVNRKEIGQMLAGGHGYWYFDIGNTHFRDLDMLDEIKTAREIADELATRGTGGFKPDVAVIISEGSQYWGYPLRRSRSGWLSLQSYDYISLKTSGVPYDEHYLEDLLQDEALHDYKVFVFQDAFRLTDAERAYLQENLQGNGRVLIWQYAAGFLADEGPSLEAMKELIGMQVATDPQLARTDAFWVDELDSLSQDVSGLQGMAGAYRSMYAGTESIVRHIDVQRFWIEDREAKTLARYRDGRAAIGVRRFPDWTSIYIAAPGAIDSQLLHNAAVEAGAYVLTSPGPAIEMNNHFLSVHGMRDQQAVFKLPAAASVKNLESGEWVVRGSKSFTFPIEAQGQYWFSIEPK